MEGGEGFDLSLLIRGTNGLIRRPQEKQTTTVTASSTRRFGPITALLLKKKPLRVGPITVLVSEERKKMNREQDQWQDGAEISKRHKSPIVFRWLADADESLAVLHLFFSFFLSFRFLIVAGIALELRS